MVVGGLEAAQRLRDGPAVLLEGRAGRLGGHPGQQRQQGRLELAVGPLQRGPHVGLVGAAGLAQDADDPAAQLGVGGHHVDHEVGPGPAEPDHDGGREAVEHELLGGAGLEPGRAGDHLGAGVDGQQQVGGIGQLGPGVRRDQQRERAPPAGGSQGAGDVRRAAGGGEPDDHVARADLRGVPGAQLGVVLDVLDRRDQRRRAAGVVGDEQALGGVEGGQQLGGVDDRQPPGGAGAEVVDRAAAADPVDGQVDRRRQLRQDLLHRRCHQGVLGVERLQQLEGAHRVEAAGAGVALLRGRAHAHLGWTRSSSVGHAVRLVSNGHDVNNVSHCQRGVPRRHHAWT